MTFGEKLRQLRDSASLTQEQLADGSGINLWTIRGYEQGRREPNWKAAIQLAGALGVTVEVFADCVEAAAPEPPRAKGRPKKAAAEGETPTKRKGKK